MNANLKDLEGAWKIVELELDGRKIPETSGQIVVNGNRFISLGMGEEYEGELQADFSANPHTLDMIFVAGPEKGNRNLGIFEVNNDTWTLCLATRGNTRPSAFATAPGTGIALEKLTRISGS